MAPGRCDCGRVALTSGTCGPGGCMVPRTTRKLWTWPVCQGTGKSPMAGANSTGLTGRCHPCNGTGIVWG